MLSAKMIKIFLIFVSIAGVRNEVLQTFSSGMGFVQEKPVMIPYLLGSVPNTAISIYGMNYFNNSVTLCDKDDNIIFVYLGMKKGLHYSVTIATVESGFRIFEYGEEIHFQETDIKDAAKIYISEPGLARAVIAKNEPTWAFYDDQYLIGSDYNINDGIEVPTSFNLSMENNYRINFGDYLMFAGEMKNATYVQIDLSGKENIALHMILRLAGEPFLKVSAVEKGVERYIDTSSGHKPFERSRFTVHLVCEQRAWRIYINGLEQHYFYHRLPPQGIRTAVLKGDGWRVKKYIQKYTE